MGRESKKQGKKWGGNKILSGLSDVRNSCTRVSTLLPTNLNQFDRKVRLNFVFTRWRVGIRQRAVSWGDELNRRRKTLRRRLVYDPPTWTRGRQEDGRKEEWPEGRTDTVWSNLRLLNNDPLFFFMWIHFQLFIQRNSLKWKKSEFMTCIFLQSNFLPTWQISRQSNENCKFNFIHSSHST